ncbi:MAG: carboxypeptidase regulatory-like domain-containing protein, partial [Acidobacteriota bacterium]
MIHRRLQRGLLSVVLVLSSTGISYSQTSSITGTVTDQTKAPAAGVAIRIDGVDTGSVREVRSNDQGNFSVPLLQPGAYRLTAQKEGFKAVTRSGIRLDVGETARLDLTLELGSVAESVAVTADAPLLDTEGATVGKVVESRRIDDLPLNGRNVLALTMITPGVKSNAGPANSGFADRGLTLSMISINGGPSAANEIILDGISSIQPVFADPTINPPVDAVQEFRVQSGTMSAEYGFTAGGVVNLVTKSGSNQMHGTVYHFLRNDALDARNTFAVTKPPFRFNQFGAAIGGHVIKNRLFYFGNWEEWRYNRSTPLIGTFPTAQQRTGDFSDLRDTAGRTIALYDPSTTIANPAGSGFVRTPYAGNRIPTSQLDPVSLNMQKYYPSPNRTPSDPFTNANNYSKNSAEKRNQRGINARVDYRVSNSNNLFGRFSFFDYRTDNGTTAAN